MINLDRSVDRLEAFRNQAERVGLAFERLPAIDAAGIDFGRGDLKPGEVACFESHKLAWRMLVESDEPWLAVFEDDVCLASAIVPLLGSDDWIPATADVIKLETFPERVVVMTLRGTPAPGCRLHRLCSTHLGAAGYIISRKWAAELLRLSEGYREPVDWLLFDLDTEASPKANLFQVVPALCIQEQCLAAQASQEPMHKTLIEGRENKPPKPQLAPISKWRREIGRIGCQIRRLPVTIRRALTPSRRMMVPFGDA